MNWKPLISGAAGAVTLTLVHEVVRRTNPDAPRLDVLGMRSIAKTLRGVGQEPPHGDALFNTTLAGDLAANTLYYSVVGTQRGGQAWVVGALLGLAAGVGAVTLPGPLGLGEDATNRTPQTQAMAVGWYLLGGLVAAATASCLSSPGED